MNPPRKSTIILVLGALCAIGPFSIDTYLPAFHQIALDLQTDIASVGYSLTSYFIGVSLGQLLYGPVLDRYGRRKPMLVGLVIYLLAAVACAVSPSIHWLIANRFLQALGGCVGMVGARAVVRDVFPRSETARVFSLLVLILGVAPIVAPMIGGLIVAAAGWRWIFGLLAILAAALVAAVALWIPATAQPDASVVLRPDRVVRQYVAVLREPTFLVYAVASGGVLGGLLAYIAGLPFVGMTLMGFSEQQFAWIFGINAAGFVAGSQVNGYLVRRCASSSIAFAASCVQLAAATGLIAGIALGVLHTPATLALVFVFMVCLGFLNPNTMALALNPFTRNVGSASALLGAIQMLAGATASGLVSLLHNGTALPMAGVMALSSSASFVTLLASRQRRGAAAPETAE